MPKLPANYVKAPPAFDNPLRDTSGAGRTSAQAAVSERSLVLQLGEVTWEALAAASEREGVTPEALVQRALDQWLSTAKAPTSPATPHASQRALLFDQLFGHFARRSWLECLVTLHSLVRPGRGAA
jgi:hypothetical protein